MILFKRRSCWRTIFCTLICRQAPSKWRFSEPRWNGLGIGTTPQIVPLGSSPAWRLRLSASHETNHCFSSHASLAFSDAIRSMYCFDDLFPCRCGPTRKAWWHRKLLPRTTKLKGETCWPKLNKPLWRYPCVLWTRRAKSFPPDNNQ